MKKTLALLLALVMVFAMVACGEKTNDNVEPNNPPAEQPNGPTVYTYEEDRGDFKVTWELTMYPNGVFYLNETHGLSGETTEHSGNTWRENDNGTISTGPWSDADVDKSEFFQPTGECTWILNDDGTMEPTDFVAAGPGAGSSYTYSENRGDFAVEWTLTLNEDGSYTLDEVHGLSGNLTTHTGKEWTDNGDGTLTTGAWDVDENKSEFFKPNGECTWILNDDGTVTPADAGEAAETTGIAAGKYTYIESKGPGDFQWDVLLMGNGNCRIDETNPGGEVTEHIASGWTDNGDGTVTTGEWENSDVNKSDFFKPNGEAIWKINADGTCEPVAEGEGGGAAATSAVNAGKYTFVDGETTWEVKIMGNGNCVVSELNTASGEVIKEHTTRGSADAKGWVDNGDGTFETDEWEPEEREDNKPRLASPNGVVTWKVTGDGTCEPTEKKEEASAVAYGAYRYHDTARNEYWSVMIMGNGTCVIQVATEEGKPVIGDNGPIEYKTKGFRVNDDGTFTNFAIEDGYEIPEFLSAGESGMATWKIVDAANKVVEMVVE